MGGPGVTTLIPVGNSSPPEPPPLASWSPLSSSSPLPSVLPDSPKADEARLVPVEAAVGGMVSTGRTAGLGMLDVVRGRDVGEGVGWPWGTLLGARGRALGRDGNASLRTRSRVVTDADVGCVPRAAASWHGPRLWVKMTRPWRQAMVFSWHSLPYVTPSDPQTLVALASGHVRAGQTQWAEPAPSTQEAPNSQCTSTQVLGTKEPASQPAGPRAWPSGHCPHLGPATPGLQEHSPVICSQSSRTAPRGSQLQGVQPLRLSVTMPRKFQKPGSQRSHLRPPTPGRQEHWPVAGSQVPPYEPCGLHWQMLGQPARPTPWAVVTLSWQQP